jgi:hypothetical protein
MSAIVSLLVIWFLISIPIAFFVGAVFTFSKKTAEEELDTTANQNVNVTQEATN